MCGRFALSSPKKVRHFLGVTREWDEYEESLFSARLNIAPSQPVLAVRAGDSGARELAAFIWGLVPSWSKDGKSGFINARSESAAIKPAFRAAFKQRRCLIPATYFYEWQKADGGKRPYCIAMKDEDLFAFAGLWERWQGSAGEVLETCSILTCAANELMKPIHERMPVILPPADFDRWLDPTIRTAEAVQGLLQPFAADRMKTWRVSRYVNSPKNEGSACVEPAEEGLFEAE